MRDCFIDTDIVQGIRNSMEQVDMIKEKHALCVLVAFYKIMLQYTMKKLEEF